MVMLRCGWALGHNVGHSHTLILRSNRPQQVEIGTLVARNTAAPSILASPPSAAGAAAISRASSTMAVMPTGVVLRHTPSTRALHVSPAAPSRQPVAPVAALASTPVHEHRQSLDALDAIEPESPAEHAYLQEQRDLLLRQISEAQQPQLSHSLNAALVAPDLAAAHLPLGRPTQQQTGHQVGDVGGDVGGDLGTGICVPGGPLPTDSIQVVRMKHLENHSPSPAVLRIILFHPWEELTFLPPPPPPPPQYSHHRGCGAPLNSILPEALKATMHTTLEP